MSTRREGHRRGPGARLGSALKSFGGFMTALAAIATATATILGLMVSHQSTELAQIRVTVSQQAQRIQHLTTVSDPAAASTPAAGGGAGGTNSLPSGAHYLSDLSATVDNGSVGNGQQVMVAKPYPNSIAFYCNGPQGDQPDEAYDVAGSTTFTAMAGIPDNMQGVTDVIATLTFTNEADQRIGRPLQVSLGHPLRVTLNVTGVTQLGLTCVGRDARTDQVANGFQVALGDARIY